MFSATHSLKGLSCLNSPGTPQRHSADLRRQQNFAEKSVIAAISCVEQRSFKIPQLPALREVVSESAQQKRRFFLLLFFVPRFTSRNMGILQRKWGQSLWANLMSSCHLMRKANAGVRYLVFSPRWPDKGRRQLFVGNGCRPGLVRPTQRPTGANEGGIVGGSMTEKKGFFVDGVVIRVFSKSAFPLSIFRPLATKVGPGFCPELQPPYSWTRCLPTKKPGWSCTKNQQSRTSRPADFTQLPTWVQRSVPFT